jgi:hypothetical protein
MNALAPLLGVMILSVVLVANFFRAAWRLGILRAFGRRHAIRWRVLAAGALAACLPFAGAIVALELIPSDNAIDLSMQAGQLAVQLSISGLLMHMLNDQLIVWGKAIKSPA